ncbi:ABC transporter permease [Mucilaginibacter sabulilitoris]|uniref:ABC transporter permease n=1 Tax=Mucilaginibacter sabulilitoris TaxID=1173583 RepID=A0ABZ0TEB3_9SPHI|nr:ABC transporter permease [Mucilaginibacter sabulilitoris]WPU91074.1 ABC transporter permease [Mucilaginibacter sabulilitoris]
MIRNNIKLMWRSLLKNRTYSFLNIFGLAIGIACAALIFLWVEDEVNFDVVNVKKDRLYLILENQKYDTYVFTESSTPGLMGPAMQTELPGIANTCRTTEGETSFLFAVGDRSFFASGKYADPSIFNMFTLQFAQGNAATAFLQLHSLVITQKTAKKFFGNDQNIIGKSIRVDNKHNYVVSGVLKDIPANSSVQFEWLMPYKVFFDQNPWLTNWGNQGTATYAELKPGVDPETINKQLYNYIQRREPTALGHSFLFAMNDWHLYSDFKDGKQTGGGQIEYVHLFTIIAWIILFIACINFMNLATARSEKRAREVGVRKVLGAGKKLLIGQFIGEALFMAFVAAFIAMVLVALILPVFNTLVQKQLTIGLGNPAHIVALLLITMVCGLVAGSYPALYLSSFNPVAVLKGVRLKSSGATFIRKGLVVLQFTVSIVLIICTIIVYQQIQHVKSRQLGFNKNNLIDMPMQGNMAQNYDLIKQDLLSTGYITNVALADHGIIYGGNNTSEMTWDGKPANSKVLISRRFVTPEFMETSGLTVLDGRNLTMADTVKPVRLLITKSLEKLMGKGSAVGKTLRHEGDTTSATIVGVVNDYVYGNMYGKPDPVMFLCASPNQTSVMYVRMKPGSDIEKVLTSMQNIMKKDNPAYPFDYRFVEDEFNQKFLSEALVSQLARVFASLAIIISCLGLFGLASYTAERRTKEIGIRKVLGASTSGLAGLLSGDFLKLVVLSCAVAFPLAYWAMQNWLKNYQYHIGINWWVFIVAGVVAILIALVTVSFQSIKAALANPVKSLRSE